MLRGSTNLGSVCCEGSCQIGMDLDDLECVSSSDGLMDEDEDSVHARQRGGFIKKHGVGIGSIGIGLGTGVPSGLTPAAASVHELLECPVCTNSMYPPIHQVRVLFLLLFSFG